MLCILSSNVKDEMLLESESPTEQCQTEKYPIYRSLK